MGEWGCFQCLYLMNYAGSFPSPGAVFSHSCEGRHASHLPTLLSAAQRLPRWPCPPDGPAQAGQAGADPGGVLSAANGSSEL